MGQSRWNVPEEGGDLSRAAGTFAGHDVPASGSFEPGRKLFARECKFFWAASTAAQLPPESVPEIAFAGRSNVGKSSLLNALTGRKNLARTSNTPGRTRELHFYALGNSGKEPLLHLVDLPGYGYAAAPKALAASWPGLIEEFLRGRAPLLRTFLLIDGRHGIKPSDAGMMEFLDRCAVSYQIVLTKQDCVKPAERGSRLAAARAAAQQHPAAHPEVIFASARTGEGIAELRAAVATLLTGNRPEALP